jgi:hypothetical protein
MIRLLSPPRRENGAWDVLQLTPRIAASFTQLSSFCDN